MSSTTNTAQTCPAERSAINAYGLCNVTGASGSKSPTSNVHHDYGWRSAGWRCGGEHRFPFGGKPSTLVLRSSLSLWLRRSWWTCRTLANQSALCEIVRATIITKAEFGMRVMKASHCGRSQRAFIAIVTVQRFGNPFKAYLCIPLRGLTGLQTPTMPQAPSSFGVTGC